MLSSRAPALQSLCPPSSRPRALHSAALTPPQPPALSSVPGLQGEAPGLLAGTQVPELPRRCHPIPPAAEPRGTPPPSSLCEPLHFFPPSDQMGLKTANKTPCIDFRGCGSRARPSQGVRRGLRLGGPGGWAFEPGAAQSLLSLRLRLSPAALGRLPAHCDHRPPSPLRAALCAGRPSAPLTSRTTGRQRPVPTWHGHRQRGRASRPPRRRQAGGEGTPARKLWRVLHVEKQKQSQRPPSRTSSLVSARAALGEREAGPQFEWREGVTPGSGQPGRQRGTRDVGLAPNCVSRGLTSRDMRRARSRGLLDGECGSAGTREEA